jgi:hypothetical protein
MDRDNAGQASRIAELVSGGWCPRRPALDHPTALTMGGESSVEADYRHAGCF